jgi:hypothetical protein
MGSGMLISLFIGIAPMNRGYISLPVPPDFWALETARERNFLVKLGGDRELGGKRNA